MCGLGFRVLNVRKYSGLGFGLGVYRDTGRENGNYCGGLSGFGSIYEVYLKYTWTPKVCKTILFCYCKSFGTIILPTDGCRYKRYKKGIRVLGVVTSRICFGKSEVLFGGRYMQDNNLGCTHTGLGTPFFETTLIRVRGYVPTEYWALKRGRGKEYSAGRA